MALNSGIQTNQILADNDEVWIPRLSYLYYLVAFLFDLISYLIFFRFLSFHSNHFRGFNSKHLCKHVRKKISSTCLFWQNWFRFIYYFSVPSVNVATIEKSACVQDGVSRSRHALLNGDTKNYDWDSGYTCHQLGSGAIVVQLGQPFVIDSMK